MSVTGEYKKFPLPTGGEGQGEGETERVPARCPHFGVCGGCSHQDIPYSIQLELKEQLFKETLSEFSEKIEPIVPSPDLWHYRNKMEFAFGHEGGQLSLGLHPKGRIWSITNLKTCDIFSLEVGKLLDATRSWALERGYYAFHSKRDTGQLRHLVVREGKNTGQRMVNLIATAQLESIEGFVEVLKTSGVRIDTALWSRNDGVADVAQGETSAVLFGEGMIKERICDLEWRVTPYGFMQTNTHAAEGMLSRLKDWVGSGGGALIDIYCGSGLLGLFLARQFDAVVGVESNIVSVEAARENASLNGITNTHFVCGLAEESLPKIIGGVDPAGSLTIVVDPPRVGLHKKVLSALLGVRPGAFIYVSCNPQSLVRDLEVLSSVYRIERMVPMDFYPHTPHIESMTLLRPQDL